MIRDTRIQQCRRDLLDFKNRYLTPLYGSGPLGAQEVFSFNKCVTSYRICDSPDDIDRNFRRLYKLLDLCESENELNIINSLHSLFIRFVRAKESKVSRLDEKLNNINMIYNELRRFNSFKYDQNVYDNYISLLKITQKLNEFYNINIEFKPKFIIDYTTSEEIEKEFRNNINLEFKELYRMFDVSSEVNKLISDTENILDDYEHPIIN